LTDCVASPGSTFARSGPDHTLTPSGKPLPELSGWVSEQLKDLTGLLKSDPAKVKSEFRRLNLQLTFHPTEAEPRAHYIVKGQCDLGALVFFFLRSRRPGALLDPMREDQEL
jgi:hypothetical protein